MIKLTPRQTEILAFIKRCLEDNGYPPTRAEIAQELGFKSPNAAEEHLKALARKGAIEMTPGQQPWGFHVEPRLISQVPSTEPVSMRHNRPLSSAHGIRFATYQSRCPGGIGFPRY